MQQALGILAEFSTFSGLEINRMKSEAMWLGSKQNCTDIFCFCFFDLHERGDSKFLVCILPVTNVLLKLKRTGWEGWKTLKE